MGIDTAIEWADHTANFWEGCTQISPACDNCYAMKRAERYGSVEWNGPPRRVLAGAKVVRAAQRMAKETGVKQFVFVNSLSDFFDNQADPQWRLEALDVMRSAPDCIFLLLTKRVGNIEAMMQATGIDWERNLPHVWQGITVINQHEADRDIPKLLAAKAALRIPRVFLSIEPMLGPIELVVHDYIINGYGGKLPFRSANVLKCNPFADNIVGSTGIDWVICGGESGHVDSRPMHPQWARDLRNQCAAAGVPFMFKQWGDWSPHYKSHVESRAFRPDGTRYDPREPEGWNEPLMESMYRVGKHNSGRYLDGDEHNGRPQP